MIKTWATIIVAACALTVSAQHKQGMADDNKVTDLTLDSLDKVRQARIAPGTSRKGSHPVLFLIGNSTMRNGTLGNGNNGQWGWGYFAEDFFDTERITVENQALGGTSSRTFYRRLWPDIRKALRPGDWVIISIGHNDNGPYDTGRARASIPGIDNDTVLHVCIEETVNGQTVYRDEDVYSYGGYLRRFIQETRQAGAHPVLMSLTPRNAWENGRVVRKIHSEWCQQVAAEMDVPYIDLNDRSAKKLETFGVEKMNYYFFGDKIHTSKFGAEMNARSAAEGIAECNHPQIAELKAMLKNVALPTVDVKREKGKPVVFITGDSTVKNTDSDPNGMWGWGAVASEIFDTTKVTLVNCAKAGRSCRTYLNEKRWDKVYNSLQAGDYVTIQFGHNDIGAIDSLKERAAISGTADTCHVYRLKSNGKYEVVYSFGWYLRKFINDVKEKGATPILVSLTPRNIWRNGKIERRNDTYGKWYREVVEQTGVTFVDVHNITADKYDKLGEEAVKAYFNHDHTHSSLAGARANARSFKQGIMAVQSPLSKYLRPESNDFQTQVYDVNINQPQYFSVKVPDGNYKVTVTVGSRKRAAQTVIRAESRRLMAENIATKKRELKEISFIVNKRSPYFELMTPNGLRASRVNIKEREKAYLSWDDSLNLEFNGENPAVQRIKIERDTAATTVFLCGNSTVVDQNNEPYASWGQMITRWFGSSVAISNHAESGLTARSFLNSKRLDKILSMMKAGDYVICEFGHNDEKEHQPGDGAWYHYVYNLKIFVDKVRAAGGNVVFCSPTQRRQFNDDNKTIRNSHGDFPAAMYAVAEREAVPVIHLNEMTTTFFETLGYEDSKRALVHYPPHTYAGQEKALADNTHFNPFGAYEVAKMVVMGMKQLNLPIVSGLRSDFQDFDPVHPDDYRQFKWYDAKQVNTTKPDGN